MSDAWKVPKQTWTNLPEPPPGGDILLNGVSLKKLRAEQALPKPSKTGPKPPKRIRSNPKNRGKKTSKRRKQRKASMKDCDKLWSGLIRGIGRCQLRGYDSVQCSGAIQAAHLISRRYRSTRWSLVNGKALCQAHHVFYTHRPLEWEIVCEAELASGGMYAFLKAQALKQARVDYDEIRSRLTPAGPIEVTPKTET